MAFVDEWAKLGATGDVPFVKPLEQITYSDWAFVAMSFALFMLFGGLALLALTISACICKTSVPLLRRALCCLFSCKRQTRPSVRSSTNGADDDADDDDDGANAAADASSSLLARSSENERDFSSNKREKSRPRPVKK